jgi:hypothetical protein
VIGNCKRFFALRFLEFPVDSSEFSRLRIGLNKTQQEMSQLLGVSVRAVHSYEQGWRSLPVHVERQVLFLAFSKSTKKLQKRPCWVVNKCPREARDRCPAWEFKAGRLCWFINGTFCKGKVQSDWRKKMKLCRACKMLQPLLSL